jgi:hypothetical protein
MRLRLSLLALLVAFAVPVAPAQAAACKAKRDSYTYKLSKRKHISCKKAKRAFVKRPRGWECVGTHVGGCRKGKRSFRFFHRI